MLNEIPNIKHSHLNNFLLIAGPCVIEDETLPFEIAEAICSITDELKIPYIFKASYKKANRSRLDSFTGIGDKKALNVLAKIREVFNVPVVTDIHSAEEARMASDFADVLQIPAFLCRQTDILVAAAKTGKTINVKKGQFLAPESMQFATEKIKQSGNDSIMITDRGTMFGYRDMIVDYRGIIKMKQFGYPVVLDITHSLQQPNQSSGVSGGLPELIETVARAGISIGVDGIFIETHPNPQNAKSDGSNMLHLNNLHTLLVKLKKIRAVVNEIDAK